VKENVCLLAVDGYIGCGALGDWIWWCSDILALLVILERLGWICFDRLKSVSGKVWEGDAGVCYRFLVEIGVGDDDMGIFHLVDHVLADIGDDDFATCGGICYPLLALELLVWQFALRCGRSLLMDRLVVDSLVTGSLVLVQVFDKLPDSRDGIVSRVVAARGMLLLLRLHALTVSLLVPAQVYGRNTGKE
jgi:hypothetical protein